MNDLQKFCRSLDKTDFYRLNPSFQAILYYIALHSTKPNTKRYHSACLCIIDFYEKLRLVAGIFGRKELVINPAQKIPNHIKACLKMDRVIFLLHKFNIPPTTVYFYDNCNIITSKVSETGINAITVNNALEPRSLLELIIRKKHDSKSVEMVLLDFDRTLVVSRFKKKFLRNSTDILIDRYFGGMNRLYLLKKYLFTLERMNVRLGFITFHTRHVLVELLSRINWI